jgi:RNA polymerase sigma-70 factor, ECF subfamily
MGPDHRPGAVPNPSASEFSLAPPGLSPQSVPAVVDGFVAPSFEAVYRGHAKTVARWAARLLGPGGDCEDVVQDVFLVVRRRLAQFRGEAELTTWLYEITVRVVQDWRRRRRWWSWVTGRGHSPSRGQVRLEIFPQAEMPQDPQALLESRERAQLLYRILDELGEVYRTTFILFELEGLSGERIAAITGARVGTVWVRLSRARSKFIERLRDLEAEERP